MVPTIAVGVVLYEGDSVLLVRHTEEARLPTGSYGFPAGRFDSKRDDSLEDAAVRELEEESGLVTEVEYLCKLPEKRSRLKMKDGSEEFVFYPFLCVHSWGELRSSNENVPEFVALNDLDKIVVITEDIRIISRENYNGDLS